jgi:hypothetical protein
MRSVPLRPIAACLALLVAGSAASSASAAEPPREAEVGGPPAFSTAVGAASLRLDGPHGAEVRQDGVALALRATNRTSERFGVDVNVTWGLTDWDRAGEWIDAGNKAGAWTTEKIQSVAHWAQQGGDAQGLRMLGAVFAEAFLVLTYGAVPVCYVGSVGGATTHLQLDVTGTVHVTGGPWDLWAEGGLGGAAIPERIVVWQYALGPVVGVGVDAGAVRISGRVLWSPGALNSSPRAGEGLFTASLTGALRY